MPAEPSQQNKSPANRLLPNIGTPFIYSKIGSTSSGAALAAAVPALPELRNPQFAAAASEQAVNAAPDLPVPLFSRPVPGCAAVPWIAPLVVLLSVHTKPIHFLLHLNQNAFGYKCHRY